MATETVYKCDVCGEFVHKDALLMLEARKINGEPYRVDLGPECVSRYTLLDVLQHAEAAK